MVLRKVIFQDTLMARETPPPSAFLNFHFCFWNPSLTLHVVLLNVFLPSITIKRNNSPSYSCPQPLSTILSLLPLCPRGTTSLDDVFSKNHFRKSLRKLFYLCLVQLIISNHLLNQVKGQSLERHQTKPQMHDILTMVIQVWPGQYGLILKKETHGTCLVR